MKLVQQAAAWPNHCAVIPYLGNSNAQGFIDTGSEIEPGPRDPHIYISIEAACEMATLLGWVGPSVKRGLEGRVEQLESELDDLKAQLQEADRFAEAAEYSFARFGQKIQNKPGRKAKEKEPA